MEKYFIREKIIKIIREFFYSRNFHEVIPPVLNKALPLESNLKPFMTTHEYKNKKETFYLAMSPERGIKKMLAEGLSNCFAIAPSFRNYERVGTLHAHEFIMLEWYRKGAIYGDIMNETEELLKKINKEMEHKLIMGNNPFPRLSLNDLFEKNIGEKLTTLIGDEKRLRDIAEQKGYKTLGATWGELYDQLFVNEIEPTLPPEPLFLIDFPFRISPLCKQKKDEPLLAERFELYINKIEMANGNTENTDYAYVRKIFEEESKSAHLPIDEEFLESLRKMNENTYAGIGVGIDRLAMLFV